MLVTITTASQKLSDILSEAQKSAVFSSISPQDGYFRVLIQVLGAQNVYAEFNSAATTAGSVKIAQNDSISFATDNIGKINLISESANNTNVRILIN